MFHLGTVGPNSVLPILPTLNGDPGWIRTIDSRIKSPLLCQAELRGQCFYFCTSVYVPGPCLFGMRGDPGLKCL